MNDKILVKVIIPELDTEYDVFIPINEIVWKVSKLITKIVFDLSGISIDVRYKSYAFVNKNSGRIYQNNEVVIDTDIRNGSELILVPLN